MNIQISVSRFSDAISQKGLSSTCCFIWYVEAQQPKKKANSPERQNIAPNEPTISKLLLIKQQFYELQLQACTQVALKCILTNTFPEPIKAS